MALTVFKIIFLVVAVIGFIIIWIAPLFFKNNGKDEVINNRKATKVKLVGVLVAAISLLIVIILSYF